MPSSGASVTSGPTASGTVAGCGAAIHTGAQACCGAVARLTELVSAAESFSFVDIKTEVKTKGGGPVFRSLLGGPLPYSSG